MAEWGGSEATQGVGEVESSPFRCIFHLVLSFFINLIGASGTGTWFILNRKTEHRVAE